MQKDASEKAKDQMKEDILAQQLEQTTEPTHAPETMSFEWKSTFKPETRATLFTFKLHSVQISIQFDEKWVPEFLSLMSSQL